MTVLTNGAEFKAYYNDADAWPEGRWHDDTDVLVDGKSDSDADLSEVADDALIEIRSGCVLEADDAFVDDLPAHFTKWQQKQKFAKLVIQVPHEHVDAFRAALPTFNATVL